MIHGPQLLALALIVLVAACAIGLGIVLVRDAALRRRPR